MINWFRQSGATTTLSVPTTNNSGLARQLRSKLKGTGPVGTSVKVLEMPGPTVIQSLVRNNPFPRETCGRAACPISRCRDNCSKESVLYKAVCVRCEEENPEVPPVYIGETSRTTYVRARQHREDCTRVIKKDPSQLFQEPLERTKEFSFWMVDHHRSKHQHEGLPDPEADYRFEVLAKHKEPMTRQIEEACRINQAIERNSITKTNGDKIPIKSLNRKGEGFAPRSRIFY